MVEFFVQKKSGVLIIENSSKAKNLSVQINGKLLVTFTDKGEINGKILYLGCRRSVL